MIKRNSRMFYYMTIPALILFFIFHTFPALQGVYYSFTNWRGFGNYDFVGLKNYINLFKDPRIWHSYIFTFKFAIVSTILVNTIGLLVAIGLNSKIKFKTTLRAIYFLPHILSILIVGYVFKYIFTYFLPDIASSLGIGMLTKSILGNPDLAWIGVVILAVWQSSAFHVVLYLAGLQTIPKNLYDAASIDGAGSWGRFKHITFPLIAPFFTVNMVLALKNFLMVFDHVMALTGGGPGLATESISLLIYHGGFQGGEFAYQTANAVVYFIIILIVSLFQLKVLQEREVEL
ncbi:permease component of ABC-type sugar transporter [Halobacteroides halobius DSM 5150]|uniref:Permease component of ABC-type sugar transporter n=2 Tax=Halobacteroides TaxID=42417 RepID=L0K537_HALHC|nr:sugar ABC transporter permease [Halobacteroides halobius]AGB40131.1 permease component of ABC-type sugar transporter [Halobacteroides halobius DSM 5150]